jgi:cysteine-rich repeat protein
VKIHRGAPLVVTVAFVALPPACGRGEVEGEVTDAQGCRTIVLPESDGSTSTGAEGSGSGAGSESESESESDSGLESESGSESDSGSESASESDSGTMTTGGGVCGDGVVGDEEACDGGGAMGEGGECAPGCVLNECGDGYVGGGEECDEGEGNSDAGACTSGCKNNVCGDGGLYEGVEACDDGNVDGDDGCSAACVVEELRVFVTSGTFTGEFGGIVGADERCAVWAAKAMLPGVYMAWLSDGMMSPATRFGLGEGNSGRFVLVNGEVVAEGWEELVDGMLGVAISVDEEGMGMVNGAVWTNTAADGKAGGGAHCKDWSAGDSGSKGWQGDSVKKDGAWTADPNSPEMNCNGYARLYCFQVKQTMR